MIAILTLAITEASMEAENGADAATAVLSLMMMKMKQLVRQALKIKSVTCLDSTFNTMRISITQ